MGKRGRPKDLISDPELNSIKTSSIDWISAFPVQFDKYQHSRTLPERQKFNKYEAFQKLFKQSNENNYSSPENQFQYMYNMKNGYRPI